MLRKESIEIKTVMENLLSRKTLITPLDEKIAVERIHQYEFALLKKESFDKK